MKRHSLSLKLFITIIFFIGCGETSQNQNSSDDFTENTPETLSDSHSSYGLSEIRDYKSKRYSNLVDDLFEEAEEKDKSLSTLIQSIAKATEQKDELSSKFHDYNSKSIKYFSDADQYISKIQDTIKAQKVGRIFKTLQSNYKAENKSIQKAIINLENKERELRDKEVIMKLMISAKMMKSYQVNEKLDISQFKDALEDYKELIQKTDEYIK